VFLSVHRCSEGIEDENTQEGQAAGLYSHLTLKKMYEKIIQTQLLPYERQYINLESVVCEVKTVTTMLKNRKKSQYLESLRRICVVLFPDPDGAKFHFTT